MAIGKFLKTSGIAALAAGLALAAIPSAMAQENQGRGGWRGGDRGGAAQADTTGRSRSDAQRRGGSERAAPAWRGRQQSAAPQATPNTARSAPEARRTREGRGDAQRGNWRSRDGGQAVAAPRNGVEQRQAQAREAQARQAQAREAARTNGWTGRNRTYVDPNRNRTYRDDARNTGRNEARNDRRNDGRWDNDRRNDRRWDNDRRDNRRWNNAWRNDRRYDWRSYRNSNRNIYRIGRYYAPYRNYYYRPLSAGFRLDSLFFGNSYWINDPWQYRLPPAYAGTRWVRYYDDVVLVDTYTGEVLDVIRDFFW